MEYRVGQAGNQDTSRPQAAGDPLRGPETAFSEVWTDFPYCDFWLGIISDPLVNFAYSALPLRTDLYKRVRCGVSSSPRLRA